MDFSKFIAGLFVVAFAMMIVVGVFIYEPKLFGVEFKMPKILTERISLPTISLPKISKPKKRKSIPHVAKVVDSFHGVNVFDNGPTTNVFGRNTTPCGYNLGLKYQCVEFVKRYYFERYNHKMPNSYGHAKEFFNRSIQDGGFNSDRGLRQFKNGSLTRPSIGSLMVFGANAYNPYGHVVIISDVGNDFIELIQQNPGPGYKSRGTIRLDQSNGLWRIADPDILGWLSI